MGVIKMKVIFTIFSITLLFTLMLVANSFADGHEAAADKEVDVEVIEIKEADSNIDNAKDAVEKEAVEVKEKVESEAGKKVDSMKEGEIEKAMETAEEKIDSPTDEIDDSTVVEEKMDSMTKDEVEAGKQVVEEKVDTTSDKIENVDSTVVEEKMDSMTKDEVKAVNESAEDVKDTPVEMEKAKSTEEKVDAEPVPDQGKTTTTDTDETESTPMSSEDEAEEVEKVEEVVVEQPVVEKEILGTVTAMGQNSISIKNERDNKEYLLTYDNEETVQNVQLGYRVESVLNELNNSLLRLKVLGTPAVAAPLIIKKEPEVMPAK